MNKNNELSNFDISKYLTGFKRFKGCFSKDKLTKSILKPNSYYIINIQDSHDGNGTHWTTFYVYDLNLAFYFDPMGYPPPEEIKRLVPNVIWDDKQIQDYNSTACGYFCIAFVKVTYNLKDKMKMLKSFNSLFSDPKNNDKILSKIISSLII